MTEDDTFRALKKPTYETMQTISAAVWNEAVEEYEFNGWGEVAYNSCIIKYIACFEEHGWSYDEYRNHMYKRIG